MYHDAGRDESQEGLGTSAFHDADYERSPNGTGEKAMPRANRHFLPGHVWHSTHRCSSQFPIFQAFNPPDRVRGPFETFERRVPFKDSGQNLTEVPRGRRRYWHWVFEAKKRFGLSVLN